MLEPICTDSSSAAGEALIGSAPDADAWLCLEQNGPWGRTAWTASHLDPDLGAAIEAAAGEHRVRPSLIRAPGRHADTHARDLRTVLVASSHPSRSWLLAGAVEDPAIVLDLPWTAIAAGDLAATRAAAPWLAPDPRQHLLVCTNGTRDTCCARLGRPVATATAASYPGRVWEAIHTSGHRFAPTTVLLPSGYLHGRILDATTVLSAADVGDLTPDGLRGRSCWPAGAQVAEELVRREHEVRGLDDLTVTAAGEHWRVGHRDGRSWLLAVDAYAEGERAESCGKAVKPVVRRRAVFLGD